MLIKAETCSQKLVHLGLYIDVVLRRNKNIVNVLLFRDFSDYKEFRNVLLKYTGVGPHSQVNTILNLK